MLAALATGLALCTFVVVVLVCIGLAAEQVQDRRE
jgi:hypothetical protein